MENFMNKMAKQSLFNQGSHTNPIHFGNRTDRDDRERFEIIGICYVPMQKWEEIYDEDTAYSAGTLFPSLNKPFLGGGR